MVVFSFLYLLMKVLMSGHLFSLNINWENKLRREGKPVQQLMFAFSLKTMCACVCGRESVCVGERERAIHSKRF